MFFRCIYESKCIDELSKRCGISIPDADVAGWWKRRCNLSLAKKSIMGALLLGLIYQLWFVRNRCRLEGFLVRPEHLIDSVIQAVRMKNISVRKNLSCEAGMWLVSK
ncbi:hypothetical protein RND81_11G083200 [Saponaria officinalis]|uniref:Uncharacterized protein n=1 Tax=Saponaria officinalis TaxID=3572 RepID=A0AAW1HJQ5_SAPOF